MGNRFEIQRELADAQNQLDNLCHKESDSCKGKSIGTVTIEPKYGKDMNELRSKCSELSMILEAMDASED